MTPTRWWLPVALFVVAGALTYLLVTRDHSLLPNLSIGGPIAVGVLALAELNVARSTRARLAGRPRTKPINPLAVARLAALGKASASVAAPVGGIYGGLLARVLQLSSSGADSDARISAAGVGCSLLLVVAGLALEFVCRVKHPPPSGEH